VALGDEIRFLGHDLASLTWRRGQPVLLSTYWTATAPPSADYKIFVHLVDAQGQLRLALDHFPFTVQPDFQIADIRLNLAYLVNRPDGLPGDYPATGLIPTRLWIPGNVLKETISFAADLPPGTYRLRIGLYDPASMARLDVSDSLVGGVENHIELATVNIAASRSSAQQNEVR
jgi:hypothetical protein